MIRIANVQSLASAFEYAVSFCAKNLNERVEIVVPDKLSLFMEKLLFEKLGIECSFNIAVSTLNRFAKRNLDIDKSKQITNTGSIILIHKILNENLQNFEVLKNRAYSFTYAEEIFKTISQLKASKIDYDEMLAFSSKNVQLENKIHDLARVYELYERGKAGLLDISDSFLLSAFSVTNGRENSKILFVGFDDFTAIEYTILAQLATIAEVTVVNYNSNSSNKLIYSSDVFRTLKNIAYVKELDFKVENFSFNAPKLQQFLSDNLFAIKQDSFVLSDNSLRLFSGNNVTSEIEFVARDIREKILLGARYEDFGVAVFDLEKHAQEICEIFKKYEINFYLDCDLTLNKSVLYKFLYSVFKYNFDSLTLPNIIDIINSPFCALEETDKKLIIEKLISINFYGKIDKKLDFGQELSEILVYLVEFFELLTLDTSIKVDALKEKIKKISQELDFEGTLSRISERVSLQEKIILTKSHEIVFNLFDEIEQFYPDIDAEKVYEIFSVVATNLKFNNLPLTLDAVKVVDANDCMEKFNNLYIVNCVEPLAPNLKFDCGIILDSEIEELNFSNKLSPTISHINRLARLRLYNTATLFNNTLTITYSRDESDLVKEIKKKINVKFNDKLFLLPPIFNFTHSNYRALSVWDEITESCKNSKNNPKFYEKQLENDKKIIKKKEFSQISVENLRIYDEMKTISASQLESFFRCPFSAFLSNQLKIKPRLDSKIMAIDVGNILHEIMFKYYRQKAKIEDLYQFVVHEVYAYIESDSRLKILNKSPTLKILIDEAYRVINGLYYIDENSSFSPKYFEFEFEGDRALKLEAVNLSGKVDRVDEYGEFLRIIDYKSGRADASLKELFYGNKLQLFLYATAMENLTHKRVVGEFYLPLHNVYTREEKTYSLKGYFENDHDVIIGMDKRLEAGMKSDIVNIKMNKEGLANRTVGYKELSPSEMKSLKDYAIKVSNKAVSEIKSGFIAPTPSEVTKPCNYCPYVHICLKNSSNIPYRGTKKVNILSFMGGNDEKL